MASWKELIKSERLEESLFLLMSISVLLPFYIGSAIILVTTLYLIYRHRIDLGQVIRTQSWLFIFLIYCFVVAIYFRNYIGTAVIAILFLIICLFTFYYRSITHQLFLNHLKIFTWGSIPLALMAFVEYAHYVLTHGYDLLYIFKYHNPQTRAEATFFNPNYYGLYIAMVMVMAIYLFAKSKRSLDRWLSLIAIVLNLVCLILTASRWSIPTCIVGIVLMVFFLKPKIAWLIGFALAGGFLTLFIKPDLLPRFTTLAHAFDDRFAIWYTGWQIFLTSPLIGRGPMAYVTFYYLFADQGKMHAHQLLIDTLANYGLVGIMLLVMAFSHYFRKMMDQLFKAETRLEIGLMVSMLITVLFHGMMDVGIFWIQTGYILLAILAVPFSMIEQLAKE
ncbi:O-antigen ligase family protein [Facklamia miroungae]|uniref:O-antigen ligase n=1 Tax=Facklamia miroungae TaxID=120956 RepID=A0A1G7TM85_9LACT|nr:O-antigen ligase family protein [Facklamia miroungae]NKZ29775.1 O-antigen ligase family protein [Facklamia miroungae]SDG36437.1 O-antigen ligase [Facklamia miroungae]